MCKFIYQEVPLLTAWFILILSEYKVEPQPLIYSSSSVSTPQDVNHPFRLLHREHMPVRVREEYGGWVEVWVGNGVVVYGDWVGQLYMWRRE